MESMTREESLEFLAVGTRTGKLATASLAGVPHVAPVWFAVDGADLVFTTGADSVKGRHLRANPRAALSVDVAEFPYHYVLVRGLVRTDDRAPDLLAWATRIAARYVPEGLAERYGERYGAPGEMLCRLRMERVVGARDVVLPV
jgi:PPOX class probable F420-dependent enzyme